MHSLIIAKFIDSCSWTININASFIIDLVFKICVVSIAWKGLTNWKRQLRGDNKYSILKNLYTSTIQLKRIVANFRDPFISPHEEQEAINLFLQEYKDADLSTRLELLRNNNKLKYQAVMNKRWNEMLPYHQEFTSKQIEYDMWQSIHIRKNGLNESLDEINKIISKFNYALTHQEMQSENIPDPDEKQIKAILCESKNNEFSKKISSTFEKVLDLIQTELKKV